MQAGVWRAQELTTELLRLMQKIHLRHKHEHENKRFLGPLPRPTHERNHQSHKAVSLQKHSRIVCCDRANPENVHKRTMCAIIQKARLY